MSNPNPSISPLLVLASTHSIPFSTLPSDITTLSSPAQSPAPPSSLPLAIFFPLSTHHVSLLLSACHASCIPVTPVSGATAFGGALHAPYGGIGISLARMNALVKLNEDDQDVVVQAGINWMDLNQKIKASGLWFPVDPAPGASIGGMVSMSCSGTNAYRYGTMKEWVLGLTVVLADGRVVKTRRRARKSSAGFDLTRLMIGAEGTLGVVTEAVLRLAPQPRNLVVGLVRFERVGQAVDVVLRVMRSGYKLEALELADGEQMRALNESELSEMRFEEKPTLFVKFAGPSKWVVQEQIEMVKELCRANGATKFEVTDEEDRMGTIWAARKSMAPALIKMKKRETDLFLHSDCAVPISKLPKLIEGTRELIERAAAKAGNGWFCANVGHVGDGNMHSSIICPAEDGAKAEAVLKEVARLALSLDGTITGEHGVGLELRDVLVEEVGEVGMDVMRRIKKSLDPRGILNPGKVLRLEDEGTQAKL